mgnify:CR=1 FL=1
MKSKTGQESKYREHLLSDINIYLAIYSLNSYIFEYNLLKPEDRHLYHQLQDKFDERLVSKVTEDVKKRIKQLLDDPDEFIQAKVYFKPKKLVDGKTGIQATPHYRFNYPDCNCINASSVCL